VKVVRIEDSASSVGLRSVAEDLEQCLLKVAEKNSLALHKPTFSMSSETAADYPPRDPVGHPIAFEALPQIPLEVRNDSLSAEAIDRQKHRVPTAGPA